MMAVMVDWLFLLHGLAHMKLASWCRAWRGRATLLDRLAVAALIATGFELWLR
jgi:hypothetical protein